MSMSVSFQKSTRRTNINHNNRTMREQDKLKNEHIDFSRSDENVYLIQKDLKQLYVAKNSGRFVAVYNEKGRIYQKGNIPSRT